MVCAGDLLVATVRPYLRYFARVREAPDNLVASTGYAVVRPRDGVDGRFLCQHILSSGFVEYLKTRMIGSNYPAVTAHDVRSYRLSLPPLSEQRKIGAILSSMDDAIEKTQAIVEQVRTTKGGMIKELFTRGIPGRHTRFKQTEIGRMPAEWTMAPGIDLFRLAGGYGPSAIRFDDQGECLFVKVDSFNHRTNRRLILHAEDCFSEINNPTIRLHAPGSIVFPKRGAAIFKNRVRLLGTRSTVDPNLMVMTPKDDLVPDFLMYLLIHIELFNLCDNSGIPQLNNKHLYPKLFPVPTIDEQEEIAKSIRATDDRIATEEEKMIGLTRLKQALMAVLLTGELRVGTDTEAA